MQQTSVQRTIIHRLFTVSTILIASAIPHAQTTSPVRSPTSAAKAEQEMQFSDQPNFSVAGVTDWTAVGGHGSDSTLRTTELLATATAALKSSKPIVAPTTASPTVLSKANDLRLSAERYESAGDPLSAVHAFEQAATLDPSEPNYFAWGSELLLHRAIWQAEEVFHKGTNAFPTSVRMQTGLGTALFSGARYDEAAQRLCAASDLDPTASEPYLFMGKMQIVAPNALACVQPHLARFVAQQPTNALANYLYAMTLLKTQEHAPDPAIVQSAESLLHQAITRDPLCGAAYLELGILANAQHNTPLAIQYFNSAAHATPALADAHYRLGVIYDRTGDHDKAKQEFELHDHLKQQQTAATEQQRRDIKQFLFAKPAASNP